MDRDAHSWVVDISTAVIGATAVVAILIGLAAARSERDRHGKTARFQLALDHHARIYAAAAQAIRLVSSFTRRAEARMQSEIAAIVDLDGDLGEAAPMARLRVVRELATKYLRFEIGELVPPPPIAEPTRT